MHKHLPNYATVEQLQTWHDIEVLDVCSDKDVLFVSVWRYVYCANQLHLLGTGTGSLRSHITSFHISSLYAAFIWEYPSVRARIDWYLCDFCSVYFGVFMYCGVICRARKIFPCFSAWFRSFHSRYAQYLSTVNDYLVLDIIFLCSYWYQNKNPSHFPKGICFFDIDGIYAAIYIVEQCTVVSSMNTVLLSLFVFQLHNRPALAKKRLEPQHVDNDSITAFTNKSNKSTQHKQEHKTDHQATETRPGSEQIIMFCENCCQSLGTCVNFMAVQRFLYLEQPAKAANQKQIWNSSFKRMLVLRITTVAENYTQALQQNFFLLWQLCF